MTDTTEDRGNKRRSPASKTTLGGLVLAGVVALYSFARPAINERTGWNLPSLPTGGSVDDRNAHPSLTPAGTGTSKPALATATKNAATSKNAPGVAAGTQTESKSGPLAGRVPLPAKVTTGTAAKRTADSGASQASRDRSSGANTEPRLGESPAKVATQDRQLLYGILKDLGDRRYISPAGLLFTRGSAEGHRLDHLKRHTVDDPSRAGKHGVFDGGMEGALVTLDRAYERAKTGTRTTKELDQGRTVYTVDMGTRVGYIGGRDGKQQGNPMARRVKIVLDENRVITAYPL